MTRTVSFEHFLAAALRAGAIALTFWVAATILTLFLRRIARRAGASIQKGSPFAQTLGPLRAWVVLLGLYYAARELVLLGKFDRFVDGIFYVAAVAFGVVAVARIVTFLLAAYIAKAASTSSDRFEREYLPLLNKVIAITVTTVGLLVAFRHFGVDVTALITTLGVGGLAVGFAAKETLSNMIAGFTILIDRPFRPGDRIKLATGETGDVLEIGIRSTRIRLFDQNLLVVPNAELTNTRIVNFNLPTPLGQGTVDIRVAYGTPFTKAEQLILEVVKQERSVALEPKPSVVLRRFTDIGLDLQVTFFVSQFTDAAALENRLRQVLYRRFEEEKIVIPVVHRDMHVVDKR